MSITLQNVAKYAAIVVTVFVGAILTLPQSAAAAFDIPSVGVEFEGFAWSAYTEGSNIAGIGWISMNCSNTNTCGTSNYKVELEQSGNLTGYAWSSTVGWISFNPAGPYPTGAGVLADDAQATDGSFTGNLNFGGWARVCAAAANPATCSGGTNPNAGGWDGWIALAGTAAGSYGITMTPAGAANGSTNYAWGGPVIAGWIDFSPGSGAAPVTYDTPTPPQVTFDCPDTSPTTGANITCGYTVSDPLATCELTNNRTDGLEPTSSPSPGSTSLTVSPVSDTTYTLICTNAGGPSVPDNELIAMPAPVVAPNPIVTIIVPDIVPSGTAAEVEITVTSVGGSTCDLFGPGLTGTSFTVPVAGSYTDTFLTANLTNKTNVAIECSVVNGTPYRQAASIEVTGSFQEV
jgi:hypothetical protein